MAKILDSKIFKTNGELVRFSLTWEDRCEVHYSTRGKISEAKVRWSSNPQCKDRTHRYSLGE